MEQNKTFSCILASILRSHGFEVFGVACKVGEIPKADVGLSETCSAMGKHTSSMQHKSGCATLEGL